MALTQTLISNDDDALKKGKVATHLLFRGMKVTSAFQPIVSLTHQRIVGYEALVRANKAGTPIPPPQLFDMAGNLGGIDRLDRGVAQLHLNQFARTQPPVWLFLNLHPASISAGPEALPAELSAQMAHLGLHPQQVVLEVIEEKLDDVAVLDGFIAKAREMGFRIAIDDFGVGDSNFERVWRLSPHIVKFDRALLLNAEHNRRARQLFRSLVAMIRESGSLAVVEGVETEAQAEIALETDADMFQGFFFGRPNMLLDHQAKLDPALSGFVHNQRQASWLQSQAHGDFLRLLRFEILAACHKLARKESMRDVCYDLVSLQGVKRCFLLDARGIQQGEIVSSERRTGYSPFFNPLYQSSGACWAHRDYFRNAMDNPSQINISRPYVALPDAERTITLSVFTYTNQGNMVLCVDIHPDDLFDGRLELPHHL